MGGDRLGDAFQGFAGLTAKGTDGGGDESGRVGLATFLLGGGDVEVLA